VHPGERPGRRQVPGGEAEEPRQRGGDADRADVLAQQARGGHETGRAVPVLMMSTVAFSLYLVQHLSDPTKTLWSQEVADL